MGRRRLLQWTIGAGAATTALAACSSTRNEVPNRTSGRFHSGTGAWTLELTGRPDLDVHWACGSEAVTNSRVLFVMHGTNRNASDYRDVWAELVDGHDLVVLAPEFSHADYPGAEAYNLGGMLDSSGRVQDHDLWSFAVLEQVFEAWRGETGSSQEGYDLFGHSAGAQFVHRYALYLPEAPWRRAVAANAGWYTMPDPDVDFPYGLDGGPQTDLKASLGRDLRLLLGGEDVESENLRQDRGASAQGATRIERGFAFFEQAQRAAADEGLSLGWSLEVVPEVGHDYQTMSRAAAVHLLST